MDYAHVANTTGMPIWLISLLVFFAVGIPFFIIFYLGLKILVNNLKSIGNVAKFSLLGVWLVSILTLAVFGIREATEHAINESVIEKTELNIKSGDTLKVKMNFNDSYSSDSYRHDFKIVHDENDVKKIYSNDVRLIFKSTTDSIATISIERNAQGRNFQDARDKAKGIEYDYTFENNQLLVDSYLLTSADNKFRDQEITVTVFLPEGSIIYADENTYRYHRNRSYFNDILDNGMEEHYLKVIEDDVICLDCTEDENFEVNDNESKFKVNEDGIEINDEDVSIKLNEDGFTGEDEDVTVQIDSDGINIESKDN